ncbi:MAG: YdcF family protein [Hyphomicrobiaceae bacterium]
MTGSLFFYASKVVWFLIQPSSLLILTLLGGLAAKRFGRARLGRTLIFCSATGFVVAGYSPLGSVLLHPLETRFERPVLAKAGGPAGIIVLGGAFDADASPGRRGPALNDAAERITETAVLARTFPNARIVLSGGSPALFERQSGEGQMLKSLLSQMGVEAQRITLETRSRNTFENAIMSHQLVRPTSDETWLLVTSAYHMPRAMGCFRRAGFDALPWPVDYRTNKQRPALHFFSSLSDGLRRVDVAAREWVGLAAYWFTGRISRLLPGPRSPANDTKELSGVRQQRGLF